MEVITLHQGDCLDVLRDMAARGEVVQSIVTDPPYHLVSVVKRFGGKNAAPAQHGRDGLYARQSRGFMGKVWDGGDIAFRPETWRLCWDVLAPGGHMVVFGGSRTAHRMAVAIEDAGFEIRDGLMWLYGTGFPKSHDVAKGIDRMLGVTPAVVGVKFQAMPHAQGAGWGNPGVDTFRDTHKGATEYKITAAASPEAVAWQGWGTALKPAHEPIILARKPLIGTVAENVLAHGTGALNIDGCRVPFISTEDGDAAFPVGRLTSHAEGKLSLPGVVQHVERTGFDTAPSDTGRWPANVLHDGGEEVEAAFAVSGASRFFYSAKAGAADRAGSKHPTVKPVALARYLVRLVTPPGGTVLDPFAGSGTTGEAAKLEGFNAVLVENEPEYAADIRRRFDIPERSLLERLARLEIELGNLAAAIRERSLA